MGQINGAGQWAGQWGRIVGQDSGAGQWAGHGCGVGKWWYRGVKTLV